MGCYFCSEYNRLRDHFEQVEERGGTMHHEIHAEILQVSWNEIAGRHHYGTMAHRPRPFGFDLNFCPECGRRLERNKQ